MYDQQEQAQEHADEAKRARIRAGGGSQIGQVGDGCGHQHLERGLGATDVAGLADAQLDEPGDAMLDLLASTPVLGEGWTGLERAGLLE